jgi:hypothetical protein
MCGSALMRTDGETLLSPEDLGRLEKLAARMTPHADDEVLYVGIVALIKEAV